MARKISQRRIKRKGEDVIAKPLTKKAKAKKTRGNVEKDGKTKGESYEERLALSLEGVSSWP